MPNRAVSRLHRCRRSRDAFEQHGFRMRSIHRQFVLPIAFHKADRVAAAHACASRACSARVGLLELFGSPVTSSPNGARPRNRRNRFHRRAPRARAGPAQATTCGRWCAQPTPSAAEAGGRRRRPGHVGDLRDQPALDRRGRRASTSSTTSPPIYRQAGHSDGDLSRGQRHRGRQPRRGRGARRRRGASSTAARSASTATSSIRPPTRTRRSGRATSIRSRSSKASELAREAGGAARHRGDDRPADRHLRSRRSAAAEAVSRRRAAPLADAGPRRNLLPSDLHRRSRRRISPVRRTSGGGQPHLHPGGRRGDDAERAGGARSPRLRTSGRRRCTCRCGRSGSPARACEAVCVPFGIEPPIYRRRVDFFTKSRAFDIARARAEIGYAPQVDAARRHPPHAGLVPRPWLALTRPWRRTPDRKAQDQLFAPGKSSRAEVRRAGRRPAGPRARSFSYEPVVMLAQARAGALGLVLRKVLYPLLLGSCGRNVVFGQNVVLRHPHKIHIGDNVVVDDNCLLDAKGRRQSGHPDRQRRVHRPQHDPVVQERRHRARRRRQHRLQLRGVLGEPRHDRRQRADGGVRLRHRRRSRFLGPVRSGAGAGADVGGVVVGDGAWIGAGAKILDGVTIGERAVIGAGAVVRDSVAASCERPSPRAWHQQVGDSRTRESSGSRSHGDEPI